MGYHQAGYDDVVGVDANRQRRYPFTFLRADALDVLNDTAFLDGFDAVHASPPCKSETPLRHRTGQEYTDYLTPTLEALRRLDKPWVVENVVSTTKMPGSVILCGTQFRLGVGERVLRRHRRFLSNIELDNPGPCFCSGKPIGGVYGNGSGGPQTRGTKFTTEQAWQAMGIDWMSKRGIAQALPPAYTAWVGRQLLSRTGPSVRGEGLGRADPAL